MANLADRFLSIQKEATYGTAVVNSPIYGEVDDESFSQSFEIMTREDISRYAPRKTVIGTKYSAGDISWAMLGDAFTGRLIANAFGANTYAGSSGARTNTLVETKTDTYNSLTVCVGRDGRVHRFPGQVLDSLTIGANINEYVMCSASFVGCGEDTSADHTTPAAPTDANLFAGDAFHFNNAFVRFEGDASSSANSDLVKSVEISIGLSRDTEAASALGNQTYTRKPVPGIREISGTIEFNRAINASDVVDNEPFYRELAAGLLVNGTAAAPALSLHFAGGSNESLNLEIYKVQYDPPDANISGRDIQTLKCSFTALYDEGESAMAKAIWSTTVDGDVIA